jgi:CRISPR type III-associated protein (TIGR04423 family)
MNKIKFENRYQGYLWISDRKEPITFEDAPVSFDFEQVNPFVIEGQLYDDANKKSFSIKYVDGEYLVVEYDVKALDNACDSNVTVKYLSNRMEERMLRFRQYWRPQKDKLCENMDVLTPAEFVFVGFKSEEE